MVVVAGGAVAAFASQAAYPRVVLLDRQVAPETLATLGGIAAVACSADGDVLAAMRATLARRPGPLVPLITEPAAPERYVLERHVCVERRRCCSRRRKTDHGSGEEVNRFYRRRCTR